MLAWGRLSARRNRPSRALSAATTGVAKFKTMYLPRRCLGVLRLRVFGSGATDWPVAAEASHKNGEIVGARSGLNMYSVGR